MGHAKVTNGLVDGGHDRVHGRVDGAAEAVGKDRLCHGSKNADSRFGPDLEQSWLQGAGPGVVDDLRRLHHLSRSDVEAGHIAPDIGIADNRDQPRHPRVLVDGAAIRVNETHQPKVQGWESRHWK